MVMVSLASIWVWHSHLFNVVLPLLWGYLLGLLLFPLLFKFSLQFFDRFTKPSLRIQSDSWRSNLFFTPPIFSLTQLFPRGHSLFMIFKCILCCGSFRLFSVNHLRGCRCASTGWL